MDYTGLIFGFGVAVGASLSYVFSRQWVSVRGWSLKQLLVISHVWMGAIAAIVLMLLWPENMPSWKKWLLPTLSVELPYLAGQVGTIYALRHTDASRIAPLLGIKIASIALLSTVILGQPPMPLQWFAIALAVGSAFLLNHAGGSMPRKAIAGTLFAVVGYSFSDLSITWLNETLEPVGKWQGPVIGAGLAYTFAGLGAAALLPWFGSRDPKRWVAAVPYSLAWVGSVGCLFTAISMLGVVLAVIMQSLRGLLSVLLGAAIARLGHHALETHLERSVLVRRVLAAIMMTCAIALYVLDPVDVLLALLGTAR